MQRLDSAKTEKPDGSRRSAFINLYLTKLKRGNKSVNRHIFAAAMTIGGITGLVKLVAMAKELAIAYQFGTGDVLDAFLIAYLLPAFAINVVAGSLSACLVPAYIRAKEQQGQEAAQVLFSGFLWWGIVLLVGVSLLLAVVAPYILPWIATGFEASKLELVEELFYWLLPLLFIGGMTAVTGAVLNAGERFALVAVAPMLTPLVVFAMVLLFVDRWGIYAVVAGTVTGCMLEFTVIARGVSRRGLSLLPRWSGARREMMLIRQQFLPLAAGALLMSSASVVDQAMAAMLDPGSVAALGFGNKVPALILGLGAMALGTAVLPYFSVQIARCDWNGVRHTFETYTRLILLISVPFTILLYFCSEWMVRLLFQRGAFTTEDTAIVGSVQAYYCLQIPFYILGIMGVRLITAMAMNNILIVIAVVNLIANVIGNYILMQWLGVTGIALSTSIVYLLSSLMLITFIQTRVRYAK